MTDAAADGRPGGLRRAEVVAVTLIALFLSLILLGEKLKNAPTYFDGSLERQHRLLLQGQYTNNEQSRLLQFAVPELLVRLFGLSVPHAYLLQRWLFVWIALVLFHVYLRAWFRPGTAFAGVCLLAAVTPITFLPDLQESAPLLMVTFLCGLWAVRAGRPGLFALALVVGALDNETTLVLPAVYGFYRWGGRRERFWPAAWRTLALAAPAFLLTAAIRYATRDRPHLGGAWHLPENLGGVGAGLLFSPLDYWRDDYLFFLFLYGPIWVYAYLGWREKPPFVRATLAMAPFFVAANLVTGIIAEPRQMVPLGFVLIPAAFFRLFPGEAAVSPAPPAACRPPGGTSG